MHRQSETAPPEFGAVLRLPRQLLDPGAYKAGKGAALLVLGRLSAAACGLVQAPIALHHLGEERFGAWVALVGLLWTLVGFDGGVGYALQNRIGRSLATGDTSQTAILVRTGIRWLTCGAVVLGVVGAAVVHYGDLPGWLGITKIKAAAEVRSGVMIVLAVAVLALPLSLGARIVTAAQETWRIGAWTIVASVAGLAAIAGSAALGLGLPSFVASACILPLAPHVAAAVHVAKGRRLTNANVAAPPMPPSSAKGTSLPLRGLARESALFFVPQLGAALVTSFTPTLVALNAGATIAGQYGLLQRLFGVLVQVHTLALQPTWPAYTDAAVRGDLPRARELYRNSWLLTAAVVVLLCAGVAPFTAPLLALWLRDAAPVIAPGLVWITVAWHAILCVGQPPAMLLNGWGRLGELAGMSVLFVAGALLLANVLGHAWGAVGVIAGLAAPYALINVPVITTLATRTLRSGGAR